MPIYTVELFSTEKKTHDCSPQFAASACGDAFVMLDGAIDMPYNPDRYAV